MGFLKFSKTNFLYTSFHVYFVTLFLKKSVLSQQLLVRKNIFSYGAVESPTVNIFSGDLGIFLVAMLAMSLE